MKTLFLPQPKINFFFRKSTDTAANVQPPPRKHKSNSAVRTYLFEILGEGIKQNFLGADINMEFLVLTVRNYITESSTKIRRVASRLNGRHQDHFNQTSI